MGACGGPPKDFCVLLFFNHNIMKRAFARLLTAILTFFLPAALLFGQGTQQQNAAVFEKVQALMNKQDAAGIYALTNEDFKSHIGWVNFENFAKFGMFTQGTITGASLLDYKNGISNYKTVFPTGDFSLKLSVDTTGKISYFLFKKLEAASTIAEKTTVARSSNPLETDIDKAIEEVASDYMKKGSTVGLCIGVLQKGVMRTYSYGETELGSGELPGSHSAFEIGSITKTFTATLLAWYVNTGKVALRDPITKFLPDSVKKNKALQGITLQMLANHTSGLARVPDNLAQGNKDELNPYKNYDKKKLYAYLKHCKAETPPGKAFAYSNTAAGLLGTLLEKVSGKTYAQMVDEVIATPLKLECTGIKFEEAHSHGGHSHTAHVLPVYNEKGKPTPLWDFDALAGAGALRSTSSELLKYAEANLDLNSSPFGKSLALTHTITYDEGQQTIGLGWMLKKTGKGPVYWHNGGTYGSSSYIAFMPGKGTALVILSNCAEPVDGMATHILDALQQ